MSDIKFKIKVLYIFIRDALKAWKEFVWDVELDEFVCCSGCSVHYPCGCMGTTHRQNIIYLHLEYPSK